MEYKLRISKDKGDLGHPLLREAPFAAKTMAGWIREERTSHVWFDSEY